MSVATPVRRRQQIVVAATLVRAASMLGLGLWAFLDPPSFAGFVDFAPYNEHLIHDAGAFQVGIGTALLVALWWPDGLVVALTGFAVASGLHAVSHAIDRQLGGHGSDVPSLGLLTLVAVLAIAERRVLGWVHHEDAAAATVAALERGRPGQAYNVVDDLPASWQEVFTTMARALGAPPPWRLPGWLLRLAAPYVASFVVGTSMRVANARARTELGWRPMYPNYRAGIKAMAAAAPDREGRRPARRA